MNLGSSRRSQLVAGARCLFRSGLRLRVFVVGRLVGQLLRRFAE